MNTWLIPPIPSPCSALVFLRFFHAEMPPLIPFIQRPCTLVPFHFRFFFSAAFMCVEQLSPPCHFPYGNPLFLRFSDCSLVEARPRTCSVCPLLLQCVPLNAESNCLKSFFPSSQRGITGSERLFFLRSSARPPPGAFFLLCGMEFFFAVSSLCSPQYFFQPSSVRYFCTVQSQLGFLFLPQFSRP